MKKSTYFSYSDEGLRIETSVNLKFQSILFYGVSTDFLLTIAFIIIDVAHASVLAKARNVSKVLTLRVLFYTTL